MTCISNHFNPSPPSHPHTHTPGIYFQDPEITPSGHGVFRFNAENDQLKKDEQFSNETEARAIVEGQILAKFVHARNLGFKIDGSTRVLATGGASQNTHILQVSNGAGVLRLPLGCTQNGGLSTEVVRLGSSSNYAI